MALLKGLNIAIVGGGRFCRVFLQAINNEDLIDQAPAILGVADKNMNAEGIVYARENKIFTTNDYRHLFGFKDLDMILELTRDNLFAVKLKNETPPKIRLVDHFEAGSLWISLQMEREKIKICRQVETASGNMEKIREHFDLFYGNLTEIINKATSYSLKIKMDLVEQESAMSQIIQGLTIPTFVIDHNHIVTFWNRALEKLTNYSASEMVGTDKQWKAFREKERPTMADVILYDLKKEQISQYYGDKWKKSNLIEGACEGEEFFPNFGLNGKWLFFTAAPIKRADGKVIGAIETLWDITEKKNADQGLEHYNRKLTAIESISSALSSSFEPRARINAALGEMKKSLSVESICLFLLEEDNSFRLRYRLGIADDFFDKYRKLDKKNVIYNVLQSKEPMIFEDLQAGGNEDIGLLEDEKLKSLIYFPLISDKDETFGVMRIGSKNSSPFSVVDKSTLELISNRIGVTIKNSMLQEQYIRSEEKYRSLFNSNPDPIFILNNRTLNILDTNRRAEDCYGYSRDELIGMHFPSLGDSDDTELINGLKALSKGQSIQFLKRRYYKKGRILMYINVNASYTEYQDFDVLIAATTDITESVKKEMQLQTSKMATLGLMASGMAHEINQPLNVIQVAADYFQKMVKRGGQIPHEDLESLSKDMVENVARIEQIIRHMRDFTRQSNGIADKVNINDPIRDSFKILGYKVKVHNVELRLDLQPDIPSIMAENNRLEQVFINLVTNAIDALDEKESQTPEKGWKKQLTIKSFFKKGQVLCIVSDNGTGMTKETMEKIFEPFFTTKEVGKGSGLGMSICHGIVKDYNGDIQVESQIGKGAKFVLTFPAVDSGKI
jgi:PAS domain S-box-containing protein